MNTVTYTPYGDLTYPTVADLNILFTAIKTVVDGKLDRRGDTLNVNLFAATGAFKIINVPAPTAAGDLLRPGD